jgi:dihydrofolate synthase / folylpolyglutamate synthase
MTYIKTLDYLYKQLPMFHRIGAAAYKADLSNTEAICKVLGNPEKKFKSIHIAGTNGKGSVSNYLASILQEAGFKTGLFTSPHLVDFRERIRVNGKMIPKSFLNNFVRYHQKEFELIMPSFFEWTFGLASDFFAKQEVDYAVIETGLGGRLDSTNVIVPELSVITNIGFDHMQFLGDTLEKIAREKAGIIKEGIPVVIGETQEEVSNVFIQTARRLSSPITFADQEWKIIILSPVKSKMSLLNAELLQSRSNHSINVSSPLTGYYQAKNLVTLAQCITIIRKSGIKIEDEHIKRGIRNLIKNTSFKGRWQILSDRPLVIADIGHNKDGIREVVTQIARTKYKKLHFVLGVVSDKDVSAMLTQLPENATYYFCKANIPRGLDAEKLRNLASDFHLKGSVYQSVKEAYYAACESATEEDLILIGGSAFVVAEIL